MVHPESYQLQGGNVYDPRSGQVTVVNVHRELPQDHFIWSLLCFLYCNPFCLGLAALVQSIKARDRKVMGDIEGARSHGSKAQTLNIISTVFFCLVVLSVVIVCAVMGGLISRMAQNVMQTLQK